MASRAEKNGVLFVFESDGHDWTKHISKILRSHEYNIPCTEQHWWSLNELIAKDHPVHVLMFSPLMEPQIQYEQLSYLRNESENSLLLEFNVDTKEIRMPRWEVTKTVDTSEATQKEILSTITNMYRANNDETYDSLFGDFVDIDIIPDCLYPRDKRIYILFSQKPTGKVTICLEGLPEHLETMWYTRNACICDLPETGPRKMQVSVFVEGIETSLFQKTILIVSADLILENFAENLQETLEQKKINDGIVKVLESMNFDPFSEKFCTSESKKYFAERIAEIFRKHESGTDLEQNHYTELSCMGETRRHSDYGIPDKPDPPPRQAHNWRNAGPNQSAAYDKPGQRGAYYMEEHRIESYPSNNPHRIELYHSNNGRPLSENLELLLKKARTLFKWKTDKNRGVVPDLPPSARGDYK